MIKFDDKAAAEFFAPMPDMQKLYDELASKIHVEFPDVKTTIQRSQIKFSNPLGFAYVWIPTWRKIKGRPDIYIVVSFGLDHEVKHSRIEEAVEPYPNRWTHHTIVDKLEQIDNQLMNWIREAYEFAKTKGKK
jgi:hypothetical protein